VKRELTGCVHVLLQCVGVWVFVRSCVRASAIFDSSYSLPTYMHNKHTQTCTLSLSLSLSLSLARSLFLSLALSLSCTFSLLRTRAHAQVLLLEGANVHAVDNKQMKPVNLANSKVFVNGQTRTHAHIHTHKRARLFPLLLSHTFPSLSFLNFDCALLSHMNVQHIVLST